MCPVYDLSVHEKKCYYDINRDEVKLSSSSVQSIISDVKTMSSCVALVWDLQTTTVESEWKFEVPIERKARQAEYNQNHKLNLLH